MTENRKESVTQMPVHFPASFELIIWGVLFKTPKSRARKNKIAAKKEIQTIILFN